MSAISSVGKSVSEAALKSSMDEIVARKAREAAEAERQGRIDAANQRYLDVKTSLLGTAGRRSTILANPVQSMGKLLGKSVL